MSNHPWFNAIFSGEMSVDRLFSALQRRAVNWPHLVAWYRYAGPNSANYQQLIKLRNAYQGRRCFIIGNGPSIKTMDLSPLAQEITFGLNRIYLIFDKMGFSTTFYVAMNELVIEQCAEDIANISARKFINWNRRQCFSEQTDLIFLRQLFTPQFSEDVTKGVWGGATVTYTAMQLAYYMGFQQIILIGVDHNFSTKGTPHQVVVSHGEDPNHFDPTYFGKGFRWQLPDLRTSEFAYCLAKHTFEKDGRKIVDATINGKLQVFEKAEYADLF